MALPVLVSIAPSNYVEKARWAMQSAGVAFKEERHAPIFHRFATKPKGGQTVPLLHFPDSKQSLTDSSDILDFCASKNPALYPSEEAKKLERYYDSTLGVHARRAAYFFLFFNLWDAMKLMSNPIDNFIERWLTRLLFPLMKMILVKFIGASEPAAAESVGQVEKLCREAEERLGDGPIGSRFLAGDSFSAADITFCAHMSLFTLPPEHAYLCPLLHNAGNHPLRARIERIQQSKAGQFVYWCYKHKRPNMKQIANSGIAT
ncbi:hypothetical protein P43SY_005472 [Pythium insidiosum]|uniref:GST N-terminal domain-containing protein n=1 Tax=Pythium insidiosum TaxID=114742 RepID=A0AAD5QAG0_PYTIN|nr:hypothetical protein P43SY_005472 [Pythium insidiosum]